MTQDKDNRSNKSSNSDIHHSNRDTDDHQLNEEQEESQKQQDADYDHEVRHNVNNRTTSSSNNSSAKTMNIIAEQSSDSLSSEDHPNAKTDTNLYIDDTSVSSDSKHDDGNAINKSILDAENILNAESISDANLNNDSDSEASQKGKGGSNARTSHADNSYASKREVNKKTSHQSEAELEKAFIQQLVNQGYEELKLNVSGGKAIEDILLNNLRIQMEKLNSKALDSKPFTDNEWKRFSEDVLLNKQDSLISRSRKLREKISFKLDDETSKNFILLDQNPVDNTYQVVSQVENKSGIHENRYDVAVLVNGLPLVHFELKRRGVSIKEAFKQINRYRKESFWASSDSDRAGLYSWVQIFAGSNGTDTKYWANTVKELSRIDSRGGDSQKSGSKNNKGISSNLVQMTKVPGYEFTSNWATKDNKPINDIHDFGETFMARRRLGRMLYDYCVIDVNDTMRILRPYQVYAVEAALERARNKQKNRLGTTKAGGYIWHTTGSGKTLTSFVLARMLSREQKGHSKVLFVVDRQDLDYQTKQEFNKFAPNSVDGNTNIKELYKQLKDPTVKIIVTTIQKLSRLADKVKGDSHMKKELSQALNSETVIVYDECHRSQFGKFHSDIKKMFSKHRFFGFTGTPIFTDNAPKGSLIETNTGDAVKATTEAVFGKCLHTYTIVHAIGDGNVLPFKIDYHLVEGKYDESAINKKTKYKEDNSANNEEDNNKYNEGSQQESRSDSYPEQPIKIKSNDPRRIETIANHVIYNHDRFTKGRRFNSILVAPSIEVANDYYKKIKEKNEELKIIREQAKKDNNKVLLNRIPKPLKVAIIYTYGANQEYEQTGDLESISDEDIENIENMKSSDKENLTSAINDYNKMFEDKGQRGTSFDLSNFKSYKEDISRRMKSHKNSNGDVPFDIDILIVVNMFLTGFDAPTLNTIYIDRELRDHGVIQTMSRTNRVLNSLKDHGEVVCYRDLKKNVDKALRLYGQEQVDQIVLLPSYQECLENIKDAIKRVEKIGTADDVVKLKSESKQAGFVQAWTEFLKALNVITTFSAYDEEEVGEVKISARDIQDYSSAYYDLYDQHKDDEDWMSSCAESDDYPDDEVGLGSDDIYFDITLLETINVKVDYILGLIGKLVDPNNDSEGRQKVREDIQRHVGASAVLREKRELIQAFIDCLFDEVDVEDRSYNDENNMFRDFQKFVKKRASKQLKDICDKQDMDFNKSRAFINKLLAEEEFIIIGRELVSLMSSSNTVKGFGEEREEWKMVSEDVLMHIYNEAVEVVNSI